MFCLAPACPPTTFPLPACLGPTEGGGTREVQRRLCELRGLKRDSSEMCDVWLASACLIDAIW